jgi:hypothetical protein
MVAFLIGRKNNLSNGTENPAEFARVRTQKSETSAKDRVEKLD